MCFGVAGYSAVKPKTNSNFTTWEQLSKYRVQASIGTHIMLGKKKNTVPSKDSEELTVELLPALVNCFSCVSV